MTFHDFLWGFAPGAQQAFLGLIMAGLGLAKGVTGLLSKRKGGPASAMSGTAVAAGQDVIHRSRDLDTFYKGYLQKGSPLLQEKQRAAAENVAQEYKGARESTMGALAGRGYGAAPSGIAAGVTGGLFAAEAKTGADTYLHNLLANEQFKFQAAQGMQESSQTESRLAQSLYPGQVQQPGEKLRGLVGGIGGLFGKSGGGSSSTGGGEWRDPETGLGAGMT